MVINSIEIKSLRGIRGNLTLDIGKMFDGRPPVLLLHGDNGTGKSSIVDAFEFCLQNRLHRRGGLANPEVPYILPLGANKGAVKICFDNGASFERHVEINPKSGYLHSLPKPSQAHEAYKIAPFILRRSDILLFWDTPEHQRQTVFIDVALDSEGAAVPEEFHSERLIKLDRERTKLKQKRRDFADKLAFEIGLSAAEIDFEPVAFANLVKDRIYGGMNLAQRKHAETQNISLKSINKRAVKFSKEIEALHDPISQINNSIKKLSKNNGSPRLQAVKDLLKSAEKELTSAFKEICAQTIPISDIQIKTGDIGQVDLGIVVNTEGGRQVNPKRIFSEANRDLLAFLVFLTVVYEAGNRGQNKTLVLDDVFQSVDAGIRLRVAEYVFRRFAGWQLIITTHDRLWHHQLRLLVKRHNRPVVDHTILRWDSSIGPIVIGATLDTKRRLERALEEGDTVGICANGGLLLELMCQELTVSLATTVIRRQGDQYDLGAMWPGLSSALKRSSLKPLAEEIDRWSPLRNLVGAHYNAWAQNVSLTEARGFGNAVIALVKATKCSLCSDFLRPSQKWLGLKCACENLEVADYKPR